MTFLLLVISSLIAGLLTDLIIKDWSFRILLDENSTPQKKHPWILVTAWPYFVIMKYVHKKRILKIILPVFFLLFSLQVNAADSVFQSGTTFVGLGWSGVNSAVSSNDSRTSYRLSSAGELTTYFEASNFGFTIPSSTILGVKVEIEKSRKKPALCTLPAGVSDNSVKIIQNGSISGNEKALTGLWPLTASEAYFSYGGETDLWGLSWTTADINTTTFGVAIKGISANANSPTRCIDAEIDHIQITVYYDDGIEGINKAWLMPFIQTAFASSSCTFYSLGATTTAECSDGKIINEQQDLFYGILLFFGSLAAVLYALEKRKGVKK